MKSHRIIPFLFLLLSLAGVYFSVQMTRYHYQNPKHIQNLLRHYPFLSRWISAPTEKGTPIFDENGTTSPYSSFAILGVGCNISALLSCQKVDESAYSELFNVGVAVYGVVGYTWLFLLAFLQIFLRAFRSLFAVVNLASSALGFAFTVYLTYIEIFLIEVLCPHCLISAGIITSYFVLSIPYFLSQRR